MLLKNKIRWIAYLILYGIGAGEIMIGTHIAHGIICIVVGLVLQYIFLKEQRELKGLK